MKHSLLLLPALLLAACSQTKLEENPLKVNQVGYYPESEKVAVVDADIKADKAVLLDAEGKEVWHADSVSEAVSPWSGKVRRTVNFSSVTAPGDYTLRVGSYERPIHIEAGVLGKVARTGMKAYYLQRSGMPIEEKYAGVYARPMGHPDDSVVVHPSAASAGRPAGTVFSSPMGWYDAGDYNKYIVNSGFTIGMLLISYEMNSEYYDQWNLNIPESGSGVPDMLQEVMYNLRWMATMQDPTDGGVYHKLTTPNFENFVMPTDCHQTRYVVQKSATAALDFAATMALSARVYRPFHQYDAFFSEALRQAEYAYAWAEQYPDSLYDQPGYNERCKPEVSTGMYPDSSTVDEFFWAATELFLTTGNDKYLKKAKATAPAAFRLPVWGDLEALGTYEWIFQSLRSNSIYAQEMAAQLTPSLLAAMDERLAEVPASCFHMPYGNRPTDFFWGGNAEICAGQGVAMLMAYNYTGEQKYLTGAIEDANYLLGMNATGYCYVTGMGTKQVMHPHHRISQADGIEAPLPGFLVGGPNPFQQDKAPGVLEYKSDYPDESYMDEQPSYASNEVAINWNAYLVALMAGIDAAE